MTLNPPPKLYPASQSLSESEYLYANDQYLIHTSDAVPAAVASLAQRHHPRQVHYQVPGLHRAIAHLLANPSLSATGFAALLAIQFDVAWFRFWFVTYCIVRV